MVPMLHQARQQLPYDPIEEAGRQWVSHGWGEAANGMLAITSLMRAHQIALAEVETALRPFGLTFARYEALMVLFFSRRGSLPMGIIGSRLQVHQTSVTNAIDRLESAGLVERSVHPTDRRTTIVAITEAGARLATTATDALNAQVFSDPPFQGDDLNELVAILRRLRQTAGDF